MRRSGRFSRNLSIAATLLVSLPALHANALDVTVTGLRKGDGPEDVLW